MSTRILSETANPSEGLVRAGFEVENSEAAAVPIYQIQTMEVEDHIEDAGEVGSKATWQNWIYYVVIWLMLFLGFAVIISGMTSRQENGWGAAFIM